jgi:hypothetical protein
MNNVLYWEKLNLKTNIQNGTIQQEILDAFEEEGHLATIQEATTTPFGLYLVNDFFNPMKQYDWHMCHTNFPIGQNVCNKLKEISGIEKVLIVSKYRFLVTFGKAFNENLVKESCYETFKAISPEANNKLIDASTIHDNFCLYFLNEKDWKLIVEGDDRFEEEKLILEERANTGGLLFEGTSNDS